LETESYREIISGWTLGGKSSVCVQAAWWSPDQQMGGLTPRSVQKIVSGRNLIQYMEEMRVR